MADRDDAALRLHGLLSSLLDSPPAAHAQVGQILVQVTGETSAARAAHALTDLFLAVENELRALTGIRSVEDYLANLSPIEAWLGALNLTNRWDNLPALDPAAVRLLRISSDQIQAFSPRVAIDDDTLARLRDEASVLLSDVIDADDLEVELRRFLAAQLHSILDALDHYRISGSAGLAEAIERAAGRFVNERPVPKTSKGQQFLAAFTTICLAISLAVRTAEDVAGLPPYLKHAYEQMTENLPESPKALNPGPRGLPRSKGGDRSERAS